jgi:thiamine pyrophosphate-dependent acetolactate synthase large subunit-like protein
MTLLVKSRSIDRRAFVARLLSSCNEALVVAGLGSSSYDLFAAGDNPRNFYLWGAMGGAAAFGLGLATAQPHKPVLVITGDGEQLMGIGALATIGAHRPPNLTVIVLDNGHFGETGMQRSHTSLGIRLADVARACNFDHVVEIDDLSGSHGLAAQINARAGTTFAQVFVKAAELPRSLPPRDGVFVKNRFRQALGLNSM